MWRAIARRPLRLLAAPDFAPFWESAGWPLGQILREEIAGNGPSRPPASSPSTPPRPRWDSQSASAQSLGSFVDSGRAVPRRQAGPLDDPQHLGSKVATLNPTAWSNEFRSHRGKLERLCQDDSKFTKPGNPLAPLSPLSSLDLCCKLRAAVLAGGMGKKYWIHFPAAGVVSAATSTATCSPSDRRSPGFVTTRSVGSRPVAMPSCAPWSLSTSTSRR